MIIDAFLGLNEIPLADFRIKYLSSIVDKTIILESKTTHSGNPKDLHFTNWLSSGKMKDFDIEVIYVDLKGVEGSWNRERHSRDYLVNYIYTRYPDSTFLLTDLDEIPSREQVKQVIHRLSNPVHLHTPTAYRYGNFMLNSKAGSGWRRAVLSKTSYTKLPQGGRYEKLPLGNSDFSGIHLSHLRFSPESIEYKLNSFAHIELGNRHLGSTGLLDYCDYWLIDHLGRFFTENQGLLELRHLKSFSEIQLEMWNMNECWFKFPETQPKIKRLLASMTVTRIASNVAHLPDPLFSFENGCQLRHREILGTLNWLGFELLRIIQRKLSKILKIMSRIFLI
jgi:hypothetical protein